MADLPTQRDFDDFAAWTGRDVLGPDGERLGAVEVIFLDEATGVPEWVLVSVDDGRGVRAAGRRERRGALDPRRADRASASPPPRGPEPAETLSVADERRLYEHYGLAYSQAESPACCPRAPRRARSARACASTSARPCPRLPPRRRRGSPRAAAADPLPRSRRAPPT